ncbi:PREDICTED: uncharacterized protein LOC104817209 isoform X3 [Tarenaya hassleriana]|uniref:uncharacterized protein LOC104817209 isoform X3 n=1 Tax=Tarenaya hassleriana TaxID=28532 RepID=UPI00053C2A72|nr:PREDICTED: uncharacterized protein LOC104817209 isoform X3 [Tarenaya hassleriana]
MKMVDLETVCCMCGDVGFPDKIFRCSKCHNRYQHSYCSSYYSEQGEQVEVCDWCESEAKRKNGGKHGNGGGGSSKRSYRSEYSSADSIKQQVRQGNLTPPPADKAKIGGVPSPRTTTRSRFTKYVYVISISPTATAAAVKNRPFSWSSSEDKVEVAELQQRKWRVGSTESRKGRNNGDRTTDKQRWIWV